MLTYYRSVAVPGRAVLTDSMTLNVPLFPITTCAGIPTEKTLNKVLNSLPFDGCCRTCRWRGCYQCGGTFRYISRGKSWSMYWKWSDHVR